jgi:hypothetical protein
MPGMRPAYFTKLIFFLMPMGMPRGYIMDQWTSSSVNLLFVEKIVKTAVQRTYLKSGSVKISESVLDKNTEFEYETYCQAVEFLAAELGDISPEEAEEMMFSQGRGRGLWRSYLISNRV